MRGLSAADLKRIDALAAEHGMRRPEYVKWALLATDRPMMEAELHSLVAQKARAGNMRAIEILARNMPVGATPSAVEKAESDNPFAEVIAMSDRRGT